MPPKKRPFDGNQTVPNRGRPPKRDSKAVPHIGEKTFIMKLFDRSLDLAKYSSGSPLYPICRAWMLNQPRSEMLMSFTNRQLPEPKRRQPLPDLAAELRAGTVTQVTSMPAVKQVGKISRYPAALALKEEDDRIADADLDDDPDLPRPSREELLADLKRRCEPIRKRWHQHAKAYQMQTHGCSVEVLKALYK